MWAGSAALFAYAGISFRVARRFLAIAQQLVREGNVRDQFVHRSMRFVIDYLAGDWGADRVVPEGLVEQAIRYGQLWDVQTYLGLRCEQCIHQGAFDAARAGIGRLAHLVDAYRYDFARSNASYMPAALLVERRDLGAALATLERYFADRPEESLVLLALGMRAKIQTLAGDREGAAATLVQAAPLAGRLVPPYHRSAYLASRFLLDVTTLEATIDADGGRRQLVRRARASARRLLGVAGLVARERPQAYRLAGRLDWLTGRQDRALGWWARAVAAGEALGARPELARTYMEIGQRLRGAGSRHRALGGIEAADYLMRAERLFRELDLGWDLERLEAERRAA